ncbi:transposase [Paenibacillus sp. NEAU-GSW1]|uniref:transposase n=1 Tax=Paenibacillus sp. NEAU-GSW1 TaxID=2682486 RepID=UPI0020A69F3A|nr:transposase [Paenibacillus sp. NEAU-GSW1]
MFRFTTRHYRSLSCEGCPLKERCKKAQGEREIKVSIEYLRLKRQAREQLKSEDGYALTVRRMHEPERVFGQIKNNRGFRRLLLRGLPKVGLESCKGASEPLLIRPLLLFSPCLACYFKLTCFHAADKPSTIRLITLLLLK